MESSPDSVDSVIVVEQSSKPKKSWSFLTWFTFVAATMIVGVGSYSVIQSQPSNSAIASARQQPDPMEILEVAATIEAERIRQYAGQDPECGTLPNATDEQKIECLVARLEQENGVATAKVFLRTRALQIARGMSSGQQTN